MNTINLAVINFINFESLIHTFSHIKKYNYKNEYNIFAGERTGCTKLLRNLSAKKNVNNKSMH